MDPIPLGTDWVNEVRRLAPRKDPHADCAVRFRVTLRANPANVRQDAVQMVIRRALGRRLLQDCRPEAARQMHRTACGVDLSWTGINQLTAELQRLDDIPLYLQCPENKSAWAEDHRRELSARGINVYFNHNLAGDEWILQGAYHEVYSPGA
jgi:hypothetical protein